MGFSVSGTLGGVGKALKNAGSGFGWGSGYNSSIGGMLNDLTGVTSSSAQAFRQSKYLANMSYQQQKEFAQNAHQWEMQDLAQAGLNPALTTQGSSAGSIASEGQVGNSGYTGSSASINPLSVLDAINGIRTTSASTQHMEAGAELERAQATAIIMNLDVDHETKLQLLKNLKLEGEQTKSKTWRNYNEALGYSETHSTSQSTSTSKSGGVKVLGSGGDASNQKSHSTSKTHSRSW